ncbi:hypothetical protein H5410_041823 [Solanum commersonii]|uniref:Uncharacterized protein n=1 Tax=Solanum commersonii TaxID=4109 RepID=A0A9J5XTZ0_SOLCO|nr:hypothetical protein H5410_041823 [Solanum commersonii]
MREFCNTWICDIPSMAMKVLQDNTSILKGIPCPHAIASLHHRKLDSINFISHWYNKETYMKTYNYFIHHILNMKMWPKSQNISVIPPHVRKMQKEEQGDTNKTEKLPKGGIDMLCNTCHNRGHTKIKCPLSALVSGTSASFTVKPSLRPTGGPESRPTTRPSSRFLLARIKTYCSTLIASPRSTPMDAPTSTQIFGPSSTPIASPDL